jgi:hypothetical protein
MILTGENCSNRINPVLIKNLIRTDLELNVVIRCEMLAINCLKNGAFQAVGLV